MEQKIFPRSVELAYQSETPLPYLFDVVERRLETRNRQKTCIQAEINVLEVEGRPVLGAHYPLFQTLFPGT